MTEHGHGGVDRHKFLPKRIILVRHGESEGNRDGSAYSTVPDHRIALTEQGIEQAKQAGSDIRSVISDDCKVYFYVSPYRRTRSTLREMAKSFPRKCVIGVREECRIREQDFGNFQITEEMKAIKVVRQKFGRFFYRFPQGESAADVYDRVSSFLESLWRDIDMNRLNHDPSMDLNLIIVSHGLALRVFLMKWFKWTVEQFECLHNFGNCEFRVMQLGFAGEYSLAVYHSDEQMQEWGLSSEMIVDQKYRAHAQMNENTEESARYVDRFLKHASDDDEDDDKSIKNKFLSFNVKATLEMFSQKEIHSMVICTLPLVLIILMYVILYIFSFVS